MGRRAATLLAIGTGRVSSIVFWHITHARYRRAATYCHVHRYTARCQEMFALLQRLANWHGDTMSWLHMGSHLGSLLSPVPAVSRVSACSGQTNCPAHLKLICVLYGVVSLCVCVWFCVSWRVWCLLRIQIETDAVWLCVLGGGGWGKGTKSAGRSPQ